MKKIRNVIIVFFFIALIIVLTLGIVWRYHVAPVDKTSTETIEVIIASNTLPREIARQLEEKDLIKNSDFMYVYLRLMNINNLKEGTYKLKQAMALEEIVDILSKGNASNLKTIRITFKEGINLRKVAELIEENTIHSQKDFYDKIADNEYLDTLIDKYWFLNKEIKNPDIYYSLEGYLFPDTYEFTSKEAGLEVIIGKMLDNFGKKTEKYKSFLETSDYSLHEYLTLASVVELEGVKKEDRQEIAGVFYLRLEKNMNLGSDVTTYYGSRIDMSERDLTRAELDEQNAYNTRPSSMAGELPVGPVANPSIDAIDATIYPLVTENLYFVADKYRNVHFTKNYAEHLKLIAELKEKGDWFTW